MGNIGREKMIGDSTLEIYYECEREKFEAGTILTEEQVEFLHRLARGVNKKIRCLEECCARQNGNGQKETKNVRVY